jgi:hypothetical protein
VNDNDVPGEPTAELPPYFGVIVVDTKDFSGNSDADQAMLAMLIPDVVERAFERAGLAHVWENARFPHNTGDGFGIGVETRYLPAVVSRFFDALQQVLADRDVKVRAHGRSVRLRMRASMNVGPVREQTEHSTAAVVGNAVITTHRILDSEPVRDVLNRSDPDQTFLSVVFSERVFEDVLDSGLSTIARSRVVARTVRVKQFTGKVYLYVPHPSGDLLRDGIGRDEDDQPDLDVDEPTATPPTLTAAPTIYHNEATGTHHGTTIQVGRVHGSINNNG